jgi:hypothetical protein
MPKTAAAANTRAATAMMRRGAAMASRAIPCSMARPSIAGAVRGDAVDYLATVTYGDLSLSVTATDGQHD